MTTLYHYTTAEGAEGILTSGYIMQSMDPQYARHGAGVYLTSKNPAYHNMMEISRNNFDGKMQVWKSSRNLNKVRFALELRFHAGSPIQQCDSARDVWLFTGGTLYTQHYFTGRIYYTEEAGGYKPYGLDDWYMQAANYY